MDPSVGMVASDAAIAVVIVIPVAVIAGGVAVGLRLRGRGGKSSVPSGEVASDAATDVELAKSAQATKVAEDRATDTLVVEPPTPVEAPVPAPVVRSSTAS